MSPMGLVGETGGDAWGDEPLAGDSVEGQVALDQLLKVRLLIPHDGHTMRNVLRALGGGSDQTTARGRHHDGPLPLTRRGSTRGDGRGLRKETKMQDVIV